MGSEEEHESRAILSPWQVAFEEHKQWLQTDIDPLDWHGFEYRAPGFDVNEEVNKRKNGRVIDVGGPSRFVGDNFGVDSSDIKKVWSTNLEKTAYPGTREKVDFQSDARNLPLESGSADVIFSEGFSHVVKAHGDEIFPEMHRILKDGGLYLLHATDTEGVKKAENAGFEVKEIANIDQTDPGNLFIVVFQKRQTNSSSNT